MKKRVVLLRVGVDSGCGGIQGPLFANGTFEFICIPDKKGVSNDTYGNMFGRDGKPLVRYFPLSKREKLAEQCVHVDPEFETFTYGDPTTPKSGLRTLKPGDLLVFYCGLQRWDEERRWDNGHRPALYLVGFFEVSLAGIACDFDKRVLESQFGENFHVRHSSVFEEQKNHLVLVKGGPGSRVFRKAALISVEDKDRRGRPLKVLSSGMQRVFGTFGSDIVSVQRSNPRWVEPHFVDKAVEFVKALV